MFIRVEDASAFIRGFSIGQSVYTSGGMLSSEPLDEDGSCNVMLWADYTGSNEGPLSSGDILDMYINAGAGEYEIPDNYTTAFYL